MKLRFAMSSTIASVLIALACATASASDTEVEYKSAAELQAAVAKPGPGKATISRIDIGKLTRVLDHVDSARRVVPGDVELHHSMEDLWIAHAGTAQVILGGHVEGEQESRGDNLIGGKIVGGRTLDFKPGDMLWIPAGTPHQIIPGKDGFNYIAIQSKRQSADSTK